ncbi:MAG: bifunctional folylpolyglutamate synthase/dihydrofolate synthase, partial [Candidatus Magasanikbacteria bacterium CG10_big_fil_rev_8_21_14_0_10_43_6]
MNDPKSCDIYLKRLQFFLNMLGNPEKKIPHYIHVTGTSGKGSTTSFLHSILHASGKKVGSTYSPHPTYITERWKIDNRYMSKKEFVLLVGELKPLIDKYIQTTPYDMISFFELTEVIGFL